MVRGNLWGIGNSGYGVIVEGIAAIEQRIYNVVMTSKGSDPLRPLFGCDILRYIDQPHSLTLPGLKSEILESLQIWMPEIRVKKINAVSGVGSISFEVVYTLTDQQELYTILINANNAGVKPGGEVVLNAFIPPNPKGYPYTIFLKVKGKVIGPLAPETGFTTVQELFEFARDNYGYLGRWSLQPDRILLALKNRNDKISIEIRLLPLAFEFIGLPTIEFGFNYRVKMLIDGEEYSTPMLGTVGAVFNWVESNWGIYGHWYLRYRAQPQTGLFFSNEFGFEFNKRQTGYMIFCVHGLDGTVRKLIVDTL